MNVNSMKRVILSMVLVLVALTGYSQDVLGKWPIAAKDGFTAY